VNGGIKDINICHERALKTFLGGLFGGLLGGLK
jgi:hypothetical protein